MAAIQFRTGRGCPLVAVAAFYVLLAVSILCIVPARAQDTSGFALPSIPDSSYVVDSIYITGNTHTKSFVITREMSLQPGTLITRERMEYDRNRIFGPIVCG